MLGQVEAERPLDVGGHLGRRAGVVEHLLGGGGSGPECVERRLEVGEVKRVGDAGPFAQDLGGEVHDVGHDVGGGPPGAGRRRRPPARWGAGDEPLEAVGAGGTGLRLRSSLGLAVGESSDHSLGDRFGGAAIEPPSLGPDRWSPRGPAANPTPRSRRAGGAWLGQAIELLGRQPDVLRVAVDHGVDDVIGAWVTGGRLQQPGDGGEPRAPTARLPVDEHTRAVVGDQHVRPACAGS